MAHGPTNHCITVGSSPLPGPNITSTCLITGIIWVTELVGGVSAVDRNSLGTNHLLGKLVSGSEVTRLVTSKRTVTARRSNSLTSTKNCSTTGLTFRRKCTSTIGSTISTKLVAQARTNDYMFRIRFRSSNNGRRAITSSSSRSMTASSADGTGGSARGGNGGGW